jgi:cytochrome c-type biogenesis protein CcmE
MVPLNKSIYLGGTVARGSISYVGNSRITFQISDNGCKVKVLYIGYLPELFSSGKKAVLKGKLNSQHIFIAKKVLAKHDNKYHPSANNKIYMRE